MRIIMEGEGFLPEEMRGEAWFGFVISDLRYALLYL